MQTMYHVLYLVFFGKKIEEEPKQENNVGARPPQNEEEELKKDRTNEEDIENLENMPLVFVNALDKFAPVVKLQVTPIKKDPLPDLKFELHPHRITCGFKVSATLPPGEWILCADQKKLGKWKNKKMDFLFLTKQQLEALSKMPKSSWDQFICDWQLNESENEGLIHGRYDPHGLCLLPPNLIEQFGINLYQGEFQGFRVKKQEIDVRRNDQGGLEQSGSCALEAGPSVAVATTTQCTEHALLGDGKFAVVPIDINVQGFSKKLYGGPTCCICIENFLEGDKVRIYTCGHVVHQQCWNTLRTYSNSLCPTCRSSDLCPEQGTMK